MLPVAPSPSLLPPIAIVVVVAIIVNFVACCAVAIVVVAHRAVAIIVDFVARCAVAIVGTLQDGYVRNVPLPRVPREQRASPELTAPKARIPLPGYSRLPAWIPTLPKIGNVLGLARDYSDLFPQHAIIAKNNLLSYRSCLCCFREHSTVLSQRKIIGSPPSVCAKLQDGLTHHL